MEALLVMIHTSLAAFFLLLFAPFFFVDISPVSLPPQHAYDSSSCIHGTDFESRPTGFAFSARNILLLHSTPQSTTRSEKDP